MSTALLARRRFLPLFVTQFFGAFNDNVFKNALVILITFQAASCSDSPVLVTVAAGLFIAPFFLFSATAGQFADKMDKARMIRLAKLAEIGIMIVGAFGFVTHSVELLMVVLFAMGAQSAIFGPLKYGILPQHLEQEALMGANALLQGSTFIAILAGTVVGGSLIVIPDRGAVLTAICVVVIALAGWAASRSIPPAPSAEPRLVLDRNPFRQTWRVAVMAAQQRDVLVAIIGISWFWFVGATFLQLFPGFTCDVLGGGPQVVVLLLCTFTVGVAGGSWVSALVSAGRVSLALAPFGAIGIFVFALIPTVWPPAAPSGALLSISQVLMDAANWPSLLALLGLSTSGGVFVVPLFAFVQQQSPPERRARVIAAANVLNALFMVLSALVTVALLKAGIGIIGVFAVTGVGTLLVLAGMFTCSATMRRSFLART